MAPAKLIFSLIGLSVGALALPAAGHANSLGTDDTLGFWGRPYPYGYVYHRPPAECFDIHPVETPYGPRIQETWICGLPVSARY